MEFGPLKLKHCRYGWMLFSGPYIGKCFELYGEYSESEVALMADFIQPGDTVIDVGANIGDLTLPMARMVGASGKVYAFESHSANYHTLCANIALNQICTVKTINAFAGAADSEPDAVYTSDIFPVSTVTIDSLALSDCMLIKIDVEGHELEVLQGAAETISTHKPVLYFENDRKAYSAALLEYALGLNYRLYWHLAPIFRPNNFFGNPVNQWAPKNILSLMVLGVPPNFEHQVSGLPEITTSDSWWKDLKTPTRNDELPKKQAGS